MQSHFGMRIRHNIAGIQESGALYKRWLYSSAQTKCLSRTVNIAQTAE